MIKKLDRKIILAGKYTQLEPLGLLHLSEVATQEGWKPKVVLVKDNDFGALEKEVKMFCPEAIGFSTYTGSHLPVFRYFDMLKQKHPEIIRILGGPHATYFPYESRKHAEHVVLSEGFDGLRRILRGEAMLGLTTLKRQEKFPVPDRTDFYENHPEHKKNRIKNIITRTGCPNKCAHCFNSSKLEHISSGLTSDEIEQMRELLNSSHRLFPVSIRSVDDIIEETEGILRLHPETEMIYFQDDVFGVDIPWLGEFAERFPKLGLGFHAHMRFEAVNPTNYSGMKRIDLLEKAGCTGLSFGLETADPIIRKEVLGRNTPQDLMFEVFDELAKREFKVRTFQMLGLPYGATNVQTKINLDADLETLKINVELREKTGLPTVPWACAYVPYKGTRLGEYCLKHGFYTGTNDDVPDSFFRSSVLRFPRRWIGPELSQAMEDAWLPKEQQKEHVAKLQILVDKFMTFGLMPDGHEKAREFLESIGEKGLYNSRFQKRLYKESGKLRKKMYDEVLYASSKKRK